MAWMWPWRGMERSLREGQTRVEARVVMLQRRMESRDGEAAALRRQVSCLEGELALAHRRSEELTAQLRLVVEERYFRPVVSAGRGDEPRRPPAPPGWLAEQMADVAVFDDTEADGSAG